MNYDYQLSSLIDFSIGANTTEDHNDWAAIANGMGDFVQSDAEGQDPSTMRSAGSVRRITP
jgi:hypothetical protein